MTRYSIKQMKASSHEAEDLHNDNESSHTINYLAHNKSGQAIAKLSVEHYPEMNATQETDFHTGKPVVDNEMTHTDTPVNENNLHNVPYTRPAMAGEQLAMFGHRNVPAKRVADGLYSSDTLGGKTAAMTLLGLADNASTSTIGKHLTPSYNLSKHSGGLVDRLHAEGRIADKDMPEKRLSNDHSFDESNTLLGREHTNRIEDPMSIDELKDLSHRLPAAKTHVRGLLGKHIGPQFTQMQFEGFE